MLNNKNTSFISNKTSYIRSENYHALNRNSSEKHIIRSTSTIFYDLDTLTKRHSYHYVPQYPISDCKVMKYNKEVPNKNGFRAKSEAIVQECETHIQPKLKKLDGLKRKLKMGYLNDSVPSSEVFLRDSYYTKRTTDSYKKNKNHHSQKFWSYAKYKTEHTNPIPEICEKKERGKRSEDPCPCQLFSYACPCTDKKSLTELAKNSKSLTVADHITSTPKLPAEVESHNQKCSKTKKSKHSDDKLTNTNSAGPTKKNEAVCEEPVTNKNDIPKLVEDKLQSFTMFIESRPQKKPKNVICPNCKETLDIFSTEDEDGFKFKKYPHRRYNVITLSENQKDKNINVGESEVCIHEPPCELVPLCQILPSDNIYNMSPKCVTRASLTKHNPRKIRITKPCRHHPPCVVVPSCQRLNVLKNNCEYIPPRLHHPRCVNLPLCVPFYKRPNYDDVLNKKMEDTENSECNNFSPCNLVTAYQQESLNKCQTCEYVSEFSPRFILSPEMPCPTFLSCQIPNDEIRWKCKSSKSCQFDCVDRKCIPTIGDTEYAGSDDVIYIRDVGCQFRSHNFYPKDSSRHSITSSTCFDLVSSNVGNYYSNNHTLRYEDKCTNPISGEELSLSTFTTSSIDSHCPSHGIQTRKKQTGFKSTASPIVTAFSTYQDSMLQYLPKSDEVSRATSKSDSIDTLRYLTTFPSQRSFLKGKNKNLLSIRRRNKSKRNNTTLNSRRINNVF